MPTPETVLDSTESLAWLQQSDGKERAIAEDGDNRIEVPEALRLVRELYAAGAVEVLACDVIIDDDFEDAGSLRIILPQDPKVRAALFAIHAHALRDWDTPWDPEEDQGQSFLTLAW